MSVNDFPNWADVTPEAIAAKLPKLLDDAEKAVAAIEDAAPTTYEAFVPPLDDATRELWRTWGMVSHMLGVMNSAAWRELEEAWQPKIVAFSLRVSQSKRLSEIAQRLLGESRATNHEQRTTGTRRRILEKMIQGAELAGVLLEGEKKARFNEIQMRLAKLAADFHNAVLDATGAFKFEKDGKTYTIDDANYPETMKQCADREVREKLYRARAVRAPENAARISEILQLRQKEAEILGFPNYAAKSLATKCAPSVRAVLKMIDDLDAATLAPSLAEEKELTSFNLQPSTSNLQPSTFQPWDRAFVAERLREKKYAYSEEELKRHFELDDVVKGLFRLTKFLFGVDIEEVAEKPSVWHPDVRFFAVRENDRTIAHFYFDPFVRPGSKSGGAWMNEFRNRDDRLGVTPLAVVVTNFPEKGADGQCFLPFREVETLFHEFGHALQCMLTRVTEEDAAGINLVEWDAVEVASQFMENWCLDARTGISVPDDLKAKVKAAKNFRAASACRRQLAFAKTDMILHQGKAVGPNEIKNEQFDHFGLPRLEEDLFLCAFTHIFAGGYAAGYYGYKWSEVMSADCYGAFEEANLADDAAVKTVGARYRETVLALGGSRSALEVFRAFRGRDPEIAALLRQQGLCGKTEKKRKVSVIGLVALSLVAAWGASATPVIDDSPSRVQTTLKPGLELVGVLTPKDAGEISTSRWTVDCAGMDREHADWGTIREYVAPLGISRIRVQAGWARCEKDPGIYDFAWLDQIVFDAKKRGLSVWMELSYGNPAYAGGGGRQLGAGFPTSPEGLAAWFRWVEKMTARYAGTVRDWCVWNEPDLKKGGNTNTVEFAADFAIRTAEIIRRAIPDAKIDAFALARARPGWVGPFVDELVRRGKVGLFDAIAYHGYSRNPDNPEREVPIETCRRILAERAPTLRLKQGENGTHSEWCGAGAHARSPWTEIKQAKYLLRREMRDFWLGDDTAVFHICDLDYRTSGFHDGLLRYGLIKTTGQADGFRVLKVKTSYYAVQNAVSVFNDGCVCCGQMTSSRVEGLRQPSVVDWRDVKTAHPLVVFWEGAEIPTDEMTAREVRLAVHEKPLADPVWCDLMTGCVYAVPSDRVTPAAHETTYRLPAYDSPVFLTDRSVLTFVEPWEVTWKRTHAK